MDKKIYKSKYWMITAYSAVYKSKSFCDLISRNSKGLVYIAGQIEVCPTTGKLHVQMYMQFNAQVNTKLIQELINEKAHVGVREKSHEVALRYVNKEDTRAPWASPFQYGTPVLEGKGARNDIGAAVATLKETHSLYEVWNSHPVEFLKYHRGFEKALALENPMADVQKLVKIYYGLPGTGKTHLAKMELREGGAKLYMGDSEGWFDGWNGRDNLLIDDFEPGDLTSRQLKKLLGEDEAQVRVKGGFVSVLCHKVIITSNFHPKEFGVKPYGALKRRVNIMREFTTVYAPPQQAVSGDGGGEE